MHLHGYAEYVVQDLLGGLSGIKARRMFGGYGVYQDGVIFGLIADEVLYFKVDDLNRGDYEALKSQPFTYQTSKGARAAMSYWEVPADILEDRESLEVWVKKSVEASLRSSVKGRGGKAQKHKGKHRGKVGQKERA